MDNKFNFDRVRNNMEQLKRQLPILLANQAEKEFDKNFTEQGFDGEKWKEVQRRIPGTKAYRYPKTKGLSRRSKPILIGTGRLRRAVSNSKKIATWQMIKLEVNLPYAANQNDGITLQKRQYMGDSARLRAKQKELISKTIDKIWQA
jgi:hypothetical protein